MTTTNNSKFNLDITSDGTEDINKLDLDKYQCDTTYPLEVEEDTTSMYRRIGDMVYFKDTNKTIPIRKLPKEIRRRLKL